MTIILRYIIGDWRELHDGEEGGPKEEYYESNEHQVFDEDVDEIDLSESQIISIDLSPLKNFTNLKILNLSLNQLRSIDLSPLSTCVNLQELELSNNVIDNIDFSPLSRCTNLQKLHLYSSHLKKVDLSPLSSCTNLQSLIIGSRNGFQTINLAPLCSCTSLQVFRLNLGTGEHKMQSVDLTPLSNCTQLKVIALSFVLQSRTIDITALRFCTNLQSLTIWGVNLDSIDLAPLSSCRNLQKLTLGGNHLQTIDLSPLSNCTNLQELDLHRNALQNIDLLPLSNCTILQELSLSDNILQIIDLTPLATCSNLRILNLFANKVENIDLSPLGSCTQLLELILSNNKIQTIDLSPLFNCTSLEALSLFNNEIKVIDVSPLATCTKLRTLDLSRNRLNEIDLSALGSCTNLDITWIDVSKIKVTLPHRDITSLILTLDESGQHWPKQQILTTWLDTQLFEILAPFTYHKNLRRIEDVKDKFTRIESWSSIYDFVEMVKGTPNYIELTNGILRRVGLGHLGILDKDLTELFLSTTRNMSLGDVRRTLEPEVVKTICQQIDSRGTTIGIDLAKASEHDGLAQRSQDIRNLRNEETQWVLAQGIDFRFDLQMQEYTSEKIPRLEEIVLTAYGFDLMLEQDIFDRVLIFKNPQNREDSYQYHEMINSYLKRVEEFGIKMGSSSLKSKPCPATISDACKKYITQQAFSRNY